MESKYAHQSPRLLDVLMNCGSNEVWARGAVEVYACRKMIAKLFGLSELLPKA